VLVFFYIWELVLFPAAGAEHNYERVGAIKKIKSKAPPEVAGILIPLLSEAELTVVIASVIAVL